MIKWAAMNKLSRADLSIQSDPKCLSRSGVLNDHFFYSVRLVSIWTCASLHQSCSSLQTGLAEQNCLCHIKAFQNILQYNTNQYNTIQYNTIQYNTIQYNTIQYNAM